MKKLLENQPRKPDLMIARDGLTFLKQFVSRPKQVGAILPSSPQLARRMVEWIDWKSARAVVEFGPGTGAFTAVLTQCAQPGTKLLAVEINPHLARMLQNRFPNVETHHDSVANVRQLCTAADIEMADAIICGLPWANFSAAEQQTFLAATMSILRPGGQFATFAYLQGLLLPSAQRFHGTLKRWFNHVDRSPIAWRNMPPALVYRCRR